jgi:hypothetical protein
MSAFELVFALFGLLLGLAIAEVLGGFSRAVKLRRSQRRQVRIGWLTPLLGLFVILDLTSFWVLAFGARDQLQANYLTLVAVLAIVGVYYIAASLIFPDDPEEWPDFDEHYDRQNRLVIVGLLTANMASLISLTVLEEFVPTPPASMPSDADVIVDGVAGLAILVLLIVLIYVKGRRTNAAILAVLSALLVASAVADAAV